MIRIKLNNLEEHEMIDRLYKASKAGVKVQLLVRSICCLIPQKTKLSENITIKRIVDRFLEHSRIFIFGSNQDCEVIMGSADWMNRNLHRRIEVDVPITNEECKKELVDYFDIQWNDNVKAVMLNENMEMFRLNGQDKKIEAQLAIYDYLQQKE